MNNLPSEHSHGLSERLLSDARHGNSKALAELNNRIRTDMVAIARAVHRAKQAAMAEHSNSEKLKKFSLPKLLIDRYELDRPIGAGGFGEVGRYLDRKNHGRPVAIKLSRPDRDGFGEHLLDEEARSLIRAEGHSGVVTLLDHLLVDPDGKEPTNGARRRHALVMQFIEGDTLEKNRLALMQLSAKERRDKDQSRNRFPISVALFDPKPQAMVFLSACRRLKHHRLRLRVKQGTYFGTVPKFEFVTSRSASEAEKVG